MTQVMQITETQIENSFTIRLTKTMLEKSIIDANKDVRQFLYNVFGVTYDMFKLKSRVRNGYQDVGYEPLVFDAEFASSVDDIDKHGHTEIRFYKASGRGDPRFSVKNLRKMADVGDYMCVEEAYVGSKDGEGGERVILISIDGPTQEDINNGDY